jgi:hypothetical protein
MLRRMFGPNRGEVIRELRRLHNKVYALLLTKCRSRDQIKKAEMTRACSTYGERRGAYRVLVGKLEGKRPLERPGRKWDDKITMCLRDVGWKHGLD